MLDRAEATMGKREVTKRKSTLMKEEKRRKESEELKKKEEEERRHREDWVPKGRIHSKKKKKIVNFHNFGPDPTPPP